jgi:hypothetical protein
MLDMNIEFQKLYDASVALTKVILAALKRQVESNLYIDTETVWCKQDNNSYIKQNVNRPLWAIMLHKAEDEFKESQEYINFAEAMKSDKRISRHLDNLVGTNYGSLRMEVRNFAIRPAYEFLTDESIQPFTKEKFDKFYSEMEKSLISDEIEFENLTPLCGFRMEATELVLNENTSIVKLSDIEVQEFFKLGIKLGISAGGGYEFIHGIHEYAIRTRYKLHKKIGEEKKDAGTDDDYYLNNDIEQSVVDALRIFKKGKIYPITTIKRGKGFFTTGTSYSFERHVKHFMENKYLLEKDEIADFQSFWKNKHEAKIPANNYLSVAIRRFSQANERGSVEDELIDLMISAEALFLSSGGSFSGELKYRLSHRAAMYIENDVKKQKYIFKFMQKAYDVRSSIVHGSEPKLPKKADDTQYESMKEFCEDVEQYLRVSIKKAIENTNQTKEIDWNEIIFPDIY